MCGIGIKVIPLDVTGLFVKLRTAAHNVIQHYFTGFYHILICPYFEISHGTAVACNIINPIGLNEKAHRLDTFSHILHGTLHLIHINAVRRTAQAHLIALYTIRNEIQAFGKLEVHLQTHHRIAILQIDRNRLLFVHLDIEIINGDLVLSFSTCHKSHHHAPYP